MMELLHHICFRLSLTGGFIKSLPFPRSNKKEQGAEPFQWWCLFVNYILTYLLETDDPD